MPRKQTKCVRKPGHGGFCKTAEAMERQREYRRSHPHLQSKESRKRSKRKYRISSYGLTEEQFDLILTAQNYACAMCREPFQAGQRVHVDHDHACCSRKNRSCGACLRGLLCHTCNIALGHIERRYAVARAYLDSPREWLIVARQPEPERDSSYAGEQSHHGGPGLSRRADVLGQFEVCVTQWHKSGRRDSTVVFNE
jgi:hypothetical protein